jgi:hypothetical protein
MIDRAKANGALAMRSRSVQLDDRRRESHTDTGLGVETARHAKLGA